MYKNGKYLKENQIYDVLWMTIFMDWQKDTIIDIILGI